MRNTILVVSAILSSWAGAARAADLLETPLKLELKLSFPPAAASYHAPRLLEGDGPLKLMAEGSAGGGVALEPQTRAIVSLLLSFFVGFGTGHFVLGDGSAMLFLLLDAGLLAATLVIYVAAFAVAIGGAFPGFAVLATFTLLGYGAVRVWEFVDCLFKSGILGSAAKTAAILPRGQERLGVGAFQAMAANGMTWRF